MDKGKTTVAVIGGATIDIFGTAETKIKEANSNIGTVNYSFGGVGRNIANNLAKLGVALEFLCALGDDDNAARIIEHCKSENIALNYCLKTKGKSATYLSVNEPTGDIYVAIADMKINDALTVEYFKQHLAFLNSCEIVVFDSNLSEEVLSFLTENLKTKIFVDPVSSNKAAKLRNHLNNVQVIKPNYVEAATIVGKELTAEELVTELLNKGLSEVYLTLGSEGLVFGDKTGLQYLENYPGTVVNTTGCGDAFLAGVIYGELQKADTLTKAKLGLAAASICCRCSSAINELLCEAELKKVIGEV